MIYFIKFLFILAIGGLPWWWKAEANGPPLPCDRKSKVQEICVSELKLLRPLQTSIVWTEYEGYRQRIQETQKLKAGFLSLDQMHQKALIIGPAGTLFLLSDVPYVAALRAENFTHTTCHVLANYSQSSWKEFWLIVKQNSWIDAFDPIEQRCIGSEFLTLNLDCTRE